MKPEQVALPEDLNDICMLADWLELLALASGDHNSSAGDLERVLRMNNTSGDTEEILLQVGLELERRVRDAGEGYPFILENARVVQLRSSWDEYVPYIFCLCLSYFGWKAEKGQKVNPWHLFEELAYWAAAEYTSGRVVPFGRECRRGTEPFKSAVEKLCREIGEGDGYADHKIPRNPKDDRVDLVAWRPFADNRVGKFVMFGQCAAGRNWTDNKDAEMQPEAFQKLWLKRTFISPFVRSFFIPHRITDDGDWMYYCAYAGILFDRCRVAYWTASQKIEAKEDKRFGFWIAKQVPKLQGSSVVA